VIAQYSPRGVYQGNGFASMNGQIDVVEDALVTEAMIQRRNA
jgi:hypothetical protein